MADPPADRRQGERRELPRVPKVECPLCHEYFSEVIDTRGVRRIRRCECGAKFSTVEVLEYPTASVNKSAQP